MQPSTSPVIQAEGLTRAFDDRLAVHDLTFAVAPGTILGLIGPSGSGKTTTVRMLAGTLEPTDGHVQVMGEDPMRFSRATRQQLAYMPQLTGLYPELTAKENVGFVAALYGIGMFRRGRAVKRSLELVDLWPARNRLMRDLSGGMQRRLELACALVHDPLLLFIDEPTAGIDPILRGSIWEELRRLREEGRTLVVTTQYVAEAEECDTVALITDGELVALDAPENLRRLAYGGDVLEVETSAWVDPQSLGRIGGLVSVRQPEPTRLVVVADDAAAASPRIVDLLRGSQVEVIRIAEYRPSFDEAFELLVGGWRAARASEHPADAAA